MMITFVFLTIGACVAVSNSAAVTHRIDWYAITIKLYEIETLVFDCVDSIRNVALGDYADSGPAVVAKLYMATAKAAVVFEGMNRRAKNHTLNGVNAKASIMKLAHLGNCFYESAKGDLTELSTDAAGDIKQLVFSTIAAMEVEGESMYALLRK